MSAFFQHGMYSIFTVLNTIRLKLKTELLARVPMRRRSNIYTLRPGFCSRIYNGHFNIILQQPYLQNQRYLQKSAQCTPDIQWNDMSAFIRHRMYYNYSSPET